MSNQYQVPTCYCPAGRQSGHPRHGGCWREDAPALHLDPYGIEFSVACERCGRIHTQAGDQQVLAGRQLRNAGPDA